MNKKKTEKKKEVVLETKKEIIAEQQAEIRKGLAKDIEELVTPFFNVVKEFSRRDLLDTGNCKASLYGLRYTGDVVLVNTGDMPATQEEKDAKFIEIGTKIAEEAKDVVAFAFASEAWMNEQPADKEVTKPEEDPKREEVLVVTILSSLAKANSYAAFIRRGIDLKVVKLDDEDERLKGINEMGWKDINQSENITRSRLLELTAMAYSTRVAVLSQNAPTMEKVSELLNDIIKKDGEPGK